MNFKELVTAKITSRKFLVAIAGFASGIILIVNGNTTEGVAAIIASVVGYLAAEGLIDAAAVKATTDKIDEALNENVEQ